MRTARLIDPPLVLKPERKSTPCRLVPLVVVASVLTTTGCQRKLFGPNEPRTQFETYDRMRQQDAVTEEPDLYGRTQPALRARLTPTTQ